MQPADHLVVTGGSIGSTRMRRSSRRRRCPCRLGLYLSQALCSPRSPQLRSRRSSPPAHCATRPARRVQSPHATTSTDSALVELGRTISVLAATVQTVVEETAKNPEIRAAAVQTAGKAVSLAQRTLEENRGELERLLAEASRKLAAAEATERAKAAEKSKVAPSKP